MLLLKKTKKKILNDWTETRTSPQTNSPPMKGEDVLETLPRSDRQLQLWSECQHSSKKRITCAQFCRQNLHKTLFGLKLCYRWWCQWTRATLTPQSIRLFPIHTSCERQLWKCGWMCLLSRWPLWGSQISAEALLAHYVLSMGGFWLGSCKTCQPWTFVSTISAQRKMPSRVRHSPLKTNILTS